MFAKSNATNMRRCASRYTVYCLVPVASDHVAGACGLQLMAARRSAVDGSTCVRLYWRLRARSSLKLRIDRSPRELYALRFLRMFLAKQQRSIRIQMDALQKK